MLYHVHRPKQLDHIYGNEDVIESLEGLLKQKNPPQAYLLSGPSGCGKTTIARIIADKMKAGDDFIEINSADFRGIDSVRELIKQSRFAPLKGKKKVFLIDEVHKQTNDAQNAMLKLLEDPPHHSIFILATTNEEKLISALKGRCTHLKVKQLEDEELQSLLKEICKKEKIEVPKKIISMIAEETQGHPRHAIQILDQIKNLSPKKMKQAVQKAADTQSETIELCRAIINKKQWSEIALILKNLKQEDPESIRRAVLGYATSVLLNKKDNRIAAILEAFAEPTYNTGFPGIVYAAYCASV